MDTVVALQPEEASVGVKEAARETEIVSTLVPTSKSLRDEDEVDNEYQGPAVNVDEDEDDRLYAKFFGSIVIGEIWVVGEEGEGNRIYKRKRIDKQNDREADEYSKSYLW